MEKKVGQVTFLGYLCDVYLCQYQSGGGAALELIIAEGQEDAGEPMCRATTNIPEARCAADEVCIKNYSENEGILDVLVEAKIVEPTGRGVENGWVSVPVCKLLVS